MTFFHIYFIIGNNTYGKLHLSGGQEMKNERMFKSMIAKCLVLAMSISLVPGDVWAQPRNNMILKHQVNATSSNATSSNADEFIGEEDEPEIMDDDDIATDSAAIATGSDAQGKIPVENLALLTNPVPYEEVTLDGREFTTTITTDDGPNYHVLKYTVPVGKGGYYSYDDSRYGSRYRYICNEEQYEALCHRIEIAGEPVSATASVGSLEWESYFPLSYQLEEGQDYYFISAWKSSYSYEGIDLELIREIDINLDNSGAASEGTTTLYSKGNEWCIFSSREWYDRKEQITLPEKSGYRFEGYYTATDGQGIQVIDDFGNILPAMNELDDNCSVYAYWRPFSPISYQEIRLEDRIFSKVVTGGLSPYYQVFKFSVPEGEDGFYTFYDVYKYEYISAAGYLCTPEQYEAMCHKIEQKKGAVWSLKWTDCLTYQNNGFSLYYELESGNDYYFISTGNTAKVGEYEVALKQEMRATFVAEDADQPGTMAICSKGNRWLESGNSYDYITTIDRPNRAGYKFAGYFTERNGQGIKVIDFDGEILAELGALNRDVTVYAYWEDFSPVIYEDILLQDGRFSTTCIAEQEPYYKLLRFKVPEQEAGYYTFYFNKPNSNVQIALYICTKDQYESICKGIEAEGNAISAKDCLANELYTGTITYQLEGGQEYYLIATRHYKHYDSEGEYQLLFRRDIEIKLDGGEADYQGTPALYSKGGGWSSMEGRYWFINQIEPPQRAGFLFAGYDTQRDGQGKRILDQDGYILDENISELKDGAVVYGLWESKDHEFKMSDLANGVKGIFYNQELTVTSKMTFYWYVRGELPAGLSINKYTGCITGVPTESGTKKFTIKANNSQITVSKEFTITINDQISSNDSDDSDDQLGVWTMDESGNWRYGSGSYYYVNEWKFLAYNGVSNWYYFGSDGYIVTGWMMDGTGSWYYLNPVSNGSRGVMQTGWLTDPSDGNRYYLDLQTGKMVTGWVNIEGIWYYFTEFHEVYTGWKWDVVAGVWQYENVGKRPTGALDLGQKRDE